MPLPLRVLVVDDDPDTAESFRLLLAVWGHEVAAANDGPSALALAESFQPDVALVDIGMPEMDGREVARRLRAIPGLGGALLFAVTGLAPAPALGGDFDLYLLKPVAPEHLHHLLHHLAGP